MRSLLRLIICLLFISSLHLIQSALRDPYKILGVRRNAPIAEVKRAYKKLARHWHPDKNSSPEAQDRFIEVNKAYELLMDPERRDEYHRYGTTEDTPNFRHKRDYSDYKRFEFDHFKSFFSSDPGSNFNFDFNYDQPYIFRKQTITSKAYQNKILPDSVYQPQIILFYSDFCFSCLTAEPIWQRIVLELEPLGVGFATIHSKHESSLARKIGIDQLPYIIGIIDGVVRHYKDEQLSLLRMIEFIRKILPNHLITPVNDENYENFLSGWTDNRVRVLFVNNDKLVKLRYLLTAFYFNERAMCGHVSIRNKNSAKLIQRYNIDTKMDWMLIFNEDIDRPVSSFAAGELKPQIVKDVLHLNKYLLLPRLTSQVMFDQICPIDIPRARRRLCVLLVTNNIPSHKLQTEAMRQFILENGYSEDRFRFMYIFEAKQKDFIKSLSIGSNSPENLVSHVVVLWRREHDKLLYEWLDLPWDAEDPIKLNQTKAELCQLLNKLSQSSQILTYNTKMVDLIDEHANGLFGRIIKKLLIMTDNIGDNISKKDVLPFLSVVASFGFILLIGYIMHHLVKMEEQSIQEQYRKLGKTPPGTKPKSEPKLSIHELRGETYNGLIRMLKPGCRTIVLLCDASSKVKLLQKFYTCVSPYRRNKTLMFAYLMVEKNVEWYKNLLLQTLGDYKDLNINPKNCIGTVLCLNGFKKYFCVYHAKYLEKPLETEESFIGFDDDEDSEDIEAGNLISYKKTVRRDDPEVLFESDLLDGLPSWLERLFDGTTHRYHIQYWPDNMK